MYKIGLIIEQVLGHVTHTKNLQTNLPADPSIEAQWGLVPWQMGGLASRIPLYKSNWTIRSGVRARRTVAQMTRKHQLDALFFHTQVPAILATSWLKRIPSVVSLDATPLQYDALGAAYEHRTGPAWLERAKWTLNRNCFQAARKLVTWSQWTKQGLVDEYEVPAEKVVVIPPGVNPAEWARPTPRCIHDGPVKILFVGSDLERKGGLELLEAFRTLRPSGAELHLVTRTALPPEQGVVVYNAMEPNSAALKQLYHQSDIFCLPTRGDCLPMVLSEAGAAGLPVVSTDVGAIGEIVGEGETGLLVPVGDVAALTTSLRTLIENPHLRLHQGHRAVDVVRTRFDAQRNAQRLLALLKQTVDETRQQRSLA